MKQLFKKLLNYSPDGSFIYLFKPIFNFIKTELSTKKKLKNSIKFLKTNNIKPVFLDVGAAGAGSQTWSYFSKKNIVKQILIDVNNKWGNRYNIINNAIGDFDGECSFYETRHPGCSSCLEPNLKETKKYHIKNYFEVKNIKPIQLKRFDTLVKENLCDVPHFIKMDVQGFEYQCLKGFGKLLDKVLCLELETQFFEMYKNQKCFNELNDFLVGEGFYLRKISEVNWPFNKSIKTLNYIAEADVFYSRMPSNKSEKLLINFWESVCGIKQNDFYETNQEQLSRIDSIPI